MSHSTRVRGLKYYGILTAGGTGIVALYTSAWIEIQKFLDNLSLIFVALYTSAWIEIQLAESVKHTSGVALYTSAWIEIFLSPCTPWICAVALYTSAWIEIPGGAICVQSATCRTLHECVD